VVKSEFRMGYTLTFFIASQFFNLAMRMDLFLLSYFLSRSPEIGYYGLSQKIILTVMASVASITQVLSPNFSNLKTKEEIKHQFKIGFYYLLIPTGLFFLLFMTPNWVFYLFFTEKFAPTAAITKALSLAFLIYPVLSLPLLYILYTVKKPIHILTSNLIIFLTVIIGCYFFIPKYGVFGPPYVLALSFVLGGIVLLVASILEYKKIKVSSIPQKTAL